MVQQLFVKADQALPLNCPKCGQPLKARQEDDSAIVYICEADGLFWIDGQGYLRSHGRVIRFPAFDR
jgi:hypothetical protein